MKPIDRVLAVLLLLGTAGCASAPHGAAGPLATSAETASTAEPPLAQDEAADDEPDADAGGDFRNWIPDIFRDLWDVVDADIGTGYGFGLHLKATNFLRVGVLDHSDFGLFGLEADTLEDGTWHCPFAPEGADEGDLNPVVDLGATLGIGWGASIVLHPYEIADLLTTIVCGGFWSLEDD